MMFAISMVPIIGLAGVSIDYSRALTARQNLIAAIDGAALAAGGAHTDDAAVLEAIANQYIERNYDPKPGGPIADLLIDGDAEHVMIRAQVDVETTILAAFGYDAMSVIAESEVARVPPPTVEVALALDNTGSMRGTKIDSLRVAAQTLIDTIFDAVEDDGEGTIKAALVPFAATVNIGANASDDWLDLNGDALHHGENFDEESGPVNHFDLLDDLDHDFMGCVEARPEGLDVSDVAPGVASGIYASADSLFVPYFWPDEPDIDLSYYSYIPDVVGGDAAARQAFAGKYDEDDAEDFSGSGPDRGCIEQEITPLTDNRTTILSEIEDMVASGWTNIPLGVVWGWRVLSPGEPFSQGAPYGGVNTRKILIVLTDGKNVFPRAANELNGSGYSPYGYVAQGRLDATTSQEASDALDDKLTEACANARAAGLIVYTITFDLDDEDTKSLMRNCASGPNAYFDSPSPSDLVGVFEEIAQDIVTARLRIVR